MNLERPEKLYRYFKTEDADFCDRFLAGEIHVTTAYTCYELEGRYGQAPDATLFPDSYLLCFSKTFSPLLLQRLGGCCVEITNVVDFEDILGKNLHAHIPLWRMQSVEVHYEDNNFERGWSIPFGKTPLFQEEEEYRMQMVPHEAPHEPLKPVVLNIPALAPFCRRIR